MNPPETAMSAPTRVAVRPGFLLFLVLGRGRPVQKGEERPVSANEGGKLLALWAAARAVAAPLIPLLLGAAAMALLLDSGTVHLPPIRSGARSSSPPPERVVVSSPAPTKPVHHRSVAPPTTHTAATSFASGAGAATASTAASSAPQPPTSSGKPPASQHPHSSVSGSPPPVVAAPATQPRPAALGRSDEPAPAPAHHGLALGHAKNHVPHGPAKPHEAQVPKQPEPKVRHGHGHHGNGQGNDDNHQGDSGERHGHSGVSHGHNNENHGHSGEAHSQGPAEDHGQNGRGHDKH